MWCMGAGCIRWIEVEVEVEVGALGERVGMWMYVFELS